MKHRILFILILLIMNGCATSSSNNEDIKATIIALEKQALKLWNNGNPDGFLELSTDDIIYIDPAFESKLEGKKRWKIIITP